MYQFDKSLYEVLISNDSQTVMLEGQIEDIDIVSSAATETIQCKYHEDKDYTISSVAEPILEMLCHYIIHRVIDHKTRYILYAYFKNNVEVVTASDLDEFLKKTKDQEILVKYFHQIYSVKNIEILELANKQKKSREEKISIKDYFIANRSDLIYRLPIKDFFEVFEYRKAERHDDLKQKIMQELAKKVDMTTASQMYYPNAFTKIAVMSSYSNPEQREITKGQLWEWLNEQKSLLVTKWIFEIRDRKIVLKEKRKYLSSIFSGNSDIRAFAFSGSFIEQNKKVLVQFFIEYIRKYFSKIKLQKPPIFLLEGADISFINSLIQELFRYQVTVNNGMVGDLFLEESFVNNTNCSGNFSAKIASLDKANAEILQKMQVNYLLYVGYHRNPLFSICFRTEILGIKSIPELRYLVGIDKTLEEELV